MWDRDNHFLSNARNSEHLLKSKDRFLNLNKLFFVLKLSDQNEPGIKFEIFFLCLPVMFWNNNLRNGLGFCHHNTTNFSENERTRQG